MIKEKVWFDIIKRALKDYDVGVYIDNIFFCKFEKEITNV